MNAVKTYFSDANDSIRQERSVGWKMTFLIFFYIFIPVMIVFVAFLIGILVVGMFSSLAGQIVLGSIALVVAGAYTIVKVWFK